MGEKEKKEENTKSEQQQPEEKSEKDEVQELKEKLKEKEVEVEMYKDRALRAVADFSNFTKKSKENMDEFIRYSNAELIARFLPILDSFESAFKEQYDKHKVNYRHFYSGIELIYKDIMKMFRKEGLKHQEVLGKKFDPLLHEVVGNIEVESGEDNIILEEVRKGYMLNDKVIRHAMVKVSKKKNGRPTEVGTPTKLSAVPEAGTQPGTCQRQVGVVSPENMGSVPN